MKIIKLLLGFIFGVTAALLIFMKLSPVKDIDLKNVMSGSMEPAIKTGTTIVIRKSPFAQINPGEIVTYETKTGTSITHRVVERRKHEDKFVLITKGDANNIADIDPVSEEQVRGKAVFAIPWLGYLSAAMKTPMGFGLLVILPAVIIIGSELWNIKNEYREMIIRKVKNNEI